MVNEIEPLQNSGETRRSFLAKMGLRAAAMGIVGGPMGMIGRFRGSSHMAASQDFPSADSIFRPASDPRRDSRRNG